MTPQELSLKNASYRKTRDFMTKCGKEIMRGEKKKCANRKKSEQ